MLYDYKKLTQGRQEYIPGDVYAKALQTAHHLIERGQDPKYWAKHPTPVDPIDLVFFPFHDFFNDLSVYIPIAVAISMFWTQSTLLEGFVAGTFGLLGGIIIGFIYHKIFEQAEKIRRKWGNNKDRYRHRGVMELASAFRLKPEQITLAVVEELNQIYLSEAEEVERILKRQREVISARVEEKRRRENARDVARYRRYYARQSGSGNFHRDDDEDYFVINPASGLPMMGGGKGGIDVGGNPYGVNNNSF